MNQAQIIHLYHYLSSRHYQRKLAYELYRYPTPVQYLNYPPANAEVLSEPDERDIVLSTAKEHFSRVKWQFRDGKRHRSSTSIRLFHFGDIQPSYGQYAWFKATVAGYRLHDCFWRLLLTDVYTFQLGMRPKFVEHHLWVSIGRYQTLTGSISVGVGDELVFLARPSDYHHIDRYHRHQRNIFRHHGIIKQGLTGAVFVSTSYPVVHNGRMQYGIPYDHGDRYIFRVYRREHLVIGTDVSPRTRYGIRSGDIRMVDSNRQSVSQGLAGRIRNYVAHVIDADADQIFAMRANRYGTLLAARMISKDDTATIRALMQGYAPGDRIRFYNIGGAYWYPLIMPNQVFRSYNRGHREFEVIRQMRKMVRGKLQHVHIEPLISFTSSDATEDSVHTDSKEQEGNEHVI